MCQVFWPQSEILKLKILKPKSKKKQTSRLEKTGSFRFFPYKTSLTDYQSIYSDNQHNNFVVYPHYLHQSFQIFFFSRKEVFPCWTKRKQNRKIQFFKLVIERTLTTLEYDINTIYLLMLNFLDRTEQTLSNAYFSFLDIQSDKTKKKEIIFGLVSA